MNHIMNIRVAVIAIVLMCLSVVGVALAEGGYLGDGAYKETWTQGDG
jgi:hypothetical protein